MSSLVVESDKMPVEAEEIDFTADNNADYKEKQYWENRFETEKRYDWLVNFAAVDQSLSEFIKFEDRILLVGCGNSTLSEDMYDKGYTNLVNLDYSATVIDKMAADNAESRPLMTWVCMDMCDMNFEEQFDVVLDKAAMDAIIVDEEDIWCPNEATVSVVDRMCLSVTKCLKPGGLHLQISFAQPHFRTKYLMAAHVEDTVESPFKPMYGLTERYQWELSVVPVDAPKSGGLGYFLYVMKKQNSSLG